MRRLVVVTLPAIALGLFLARFCYELDPLRLSALGDWPGTLLLTGAVAVILTLAVRRGALIPLYLCALYVVWPEVDLRLAATLLLGTLVLIGALHLRPARTRWFDLALAAMVLTLYLCTLGNTVGRADSFEFQVVAPQLGIAHPTGYPLFILIGKLFSMLPLGTMAFRVNLLSAVAATMAVMLIYRLGVRLTSDRLAAALAALTLAASSVFWSQAVVIEVYTLNALLVSIVLTLLIQLLGKGAAGYPSPHQTTQRLIYLLAFVFGLALSHHLTSVILIPPLVIALVIARPNLPLKTALIALGLFVLGLTPWLIIPLRWPALHNGALMSIGEWTGWIFGQRFGGALNLSLWTDPARWGIISRITLEQFGVSGAMLAALGLFVLIKRAWRAALITFAAFAGYWFYGLVYNVPDVNVFIIPVFLIMAVWVSVGVHELGRLSESLVTRYRKASLRGTSLVTSHSSLIAYYSLLALLPLALIATNYTVVDQRDRDAELEAWGRYALSLPLPEGAAILADSEKIAPLYYLQVTEGLRSDLDILVLGDEAQYRQELDQRLAAGQPVYLARFLPNLPYRLRSLGPLVEVRGEPLLTVPPVERALAADFGQRLKLIGVNGPAARVTLIWQATSPERANYHVRLRLIDAQGEVWWEDRGAHPVSGYYPTGLWANGEVVSDFHQIDVEPFVPAGQYDLEVGLFVPFRDEALTVNGADWLTVTPLQISPLAAPPLTRQVRIVAGDRVITAVDVPSEVPPSSDVTIRVNASGEDASYDIPLLVASDTLAEKPVVRWHDGQSRWLFRAPASSGTYQLIAHFAWPKLARCHWLAPWSPDCAIGTLRVAGEAIGHAINFDNQVLLATSTLDRTALPPGETINVDLTWRGLKTWADNYTAFVHLIGPDGKVHGQVDQWPVQGTLPTSSWSAGQTVTERVAVTLPPDAPRGPYQVEVGWYLLATLRRLSVLDAAGRPSDDKVIIGEFVVP